MEMPVAKPTRDESDDTNTDLPDTNTNTDLSDTNTDLPLGLPPHLTSVPSQAEVQSAISEFRSFLDSEDGSAFGSKPLMPCPCENVSAQQVTIRQATQMLEEDQTFKALVDAISTNEAVWDAVSNIPEVKAFLRSQTDKMNINPQTPDFGKYFHQHAQSSAQQEMPQKAEGKSSRRKQIMLIILEFYKAIVGEGMWKVFEKIMKMKHGEEYDPDESTKTKLALATILATLVMLFVIPLRVLGIF